MNESESAPRIIRDKAFAKRLEVACENHPKAPSAHGRQVWVRGKMQERFAIKVSAEGVRKWFAGESRPRPNLMSKLAQILEVDEAWLSLGMTPKTNVKDRKALNAMATGATNLVAAQIQLAGGMVAFAEDNAGYDMIAIVRGKSHTISVRLGTPEREITIQLSMASSALIIVMPTVQHTVYRFFRVPHSVIETHGRIRGDYIEFVVTRGTKSYSVNGDPLAEISNFSNIDGVVSSQEDAAPFVGIV